MWVEQKKGVFGKNKIEVEVVNINQWLIRSLSFIGIHSLNDTLKKYQNSER